MGFLVACNNEEDPIKMKALEWSQHYSLFFSNAQGQLTPKSVMDGILSKFKLIPDFMVGLVTCKNEVDPSKMKALEWSQDFPHNNRMETICLPWKPEFWSDLVQNLLQSIPTPMMLQIKFDLDRTAGLRDTHV